MADPKTFGEALNEFWIRVSTKRSKIECQEKNRTKDEIKEIEHERANGYANLVLVTLGGVFWSGARAAVGKLKNPYAIFAANVYINFALLSMLIGAAAGTFPGLFKCPLALSGNGVLQGLLFNVMAFNIESFTSLPPEAFKVLPAMDEGTLAIVWCATAGISALIVTLVWTLATEDPVCVLVALRLIWYPVARIKDAIWRKLEEAIAWWKRPRENKSTGRRSRIYQSLLGRTNV